MNKKIIFWLDSDFVQFGLAHQLQKKYESDFYAVVDITNKTKSFFQKQNIIKFQKLWYYFDYVKKTKSSPDTDYLKNIEQKYQINLWELALNERIFQRFNHFYEFSRDEILSILEQECKLFESVLDQVQPDFFLSKETVQHKDHLFYLMCKGRGVKTLMRSEPKFGKKTMITNESQKFDSIETLDNIEGEGRNFDELLKCRNSFNPSATINQYIEDFAPLNTERLRAANKFLFLSGNDNSKTHYTYYGRTKLRVLLHELSMNFKKRSRQSFIDKNFISKLPPNEKFIYFALSVDEERNLLLSAPFFTNQLEMIRNIAKSMPIDFKLFVKEAPAQSTRNWRDISVYEEIMRIPNVTMIHPSVPTTELYKNCSLVMTISGSSGFEAAFYQKPSIVFNDPSYTILPSVTRVKSIHDLSNAIAESLKKKVLASDLDKYIVLLEKNTFSFDSYDLETKQHNEFFYGGNLIDVEISDSKMLSFLEKNKSQFQKLSEEYIKKINGL